MDTGILAHAIFSTGRLVVITMFVGIGPAIVGIVIAVVLAVVLSSGVCIDVKVDVPLEAVDRCEDALQSRLIEIAT